MTLPTLFVSHGSPMIALEPRAAGAFLQRLGPALDAAFGRPRAILVVSAHSLAREPVLAAGAAHETVHDFGGFDPRLYTMRYPAPGAPWLADRVQALLADAGIGVRRDEAGGLDHGVWTPLLHAYPAADVPVLPLAWPAHWRADALFALGRALAPLAEDGVLVLGSGAMTHNLRRVFGGNPPPTVDAPATPESAAFRDWFAARGASADWTALLAWRAQAPHAALMHPSDEHLLPFFVAAGAAGDAPQALRLHASHEYGDLGMDAYAFGPRAGALALALQAPAGAAAASGAG